MYSREFSTNDTNKILVDRMLGRAYDVVKYVYSNLDILESYKETYHYLETYDATLKKLNASLNSFSKKNGSFIGHDMGEVGVKPTEQEFVGDNFLSAITRSYDNINITAEHINQVDIVSIYIRQVNKLAEIAQAILTVYNLENSEGKKITKVLSISNQIKTVSALSSEVAVVAGAIDVNNPSKNYIPNLASKLDQIKIISENLALILEVSGHISTLKEIENHIGLFTDIRNNFKKFLEMDEYRLSVKRVSEKLNEIVALSKSFERLNEFKPTLDKIDVLAREIPEILRMQDSIISVVDDKVAIDTVASMRPEVNKVASKVDSIGIVANNIEPITAIHNNIKSVSTVSSNINKVVAVADKVPNIDKLISSIEESSNICPLSNKASAKIVKLLDVADPTQGIEIPAPANGWFCVNLSSERDSLNTEEGDLAKVTVSMKDNFSNELEQGGAIHKDNNAFIVSTTFYVTKGIKLSIAFEKISSVNGTVKFIYKNSSDYAGE